MVICHASSGGLKNPHWSMVSMDGYISLVELEMLPRIFSNDDVVDHENDGMKMMI